MSVMDKFLDVMRLNPDDEDDFDNDDYEYEEEESPKRNASRREKRQPQPIVERTVPTVKEKPAKQSTKITPISKGSRKQTLGMEVCVIKPVSIEDEIEITDTLLNGRTVVINMEGLNVEIAQRIIDFTSGSTYAMHGNLQKISNYIFLATPSGVDISGDNQNLMETFDLPGFSM